MQRQLGPPLPTKTPFCRFSWPIYQYHPIPSVIFALSAIPMIICCVFQQNYTLEANLQYGQIWDRAQLSLTLIFVSNDQSFVLLTYWLISSPMAWPMLCLMPCLTSCQSHVQCHAWIMFNVISNVMFMLTFGLATKLWTFSYHSPFLPNT